MNSARIVGQLDVLKQRVASRIAGMDKATRLRYLEKAKSCLDLTNLDSAATGHQILELSATAKKEGTAAVCVFPSRIKIAMAELSGSAVKIASVVGNFPFSAIPLELKLNEIQFAIRMGAHELDAVLPQGLFLGHALDVAEAGNEVCSMTTAAGDRGIKIILETAKLGSTPQARLENVWKASELVIRCFWKSGTSGPKYLKTATGFGGGGATFEDVAVMLDVIKELGMIGAVGLKPAGGVQKAEDALMYMILAEEMLGTEMHAGIFRIGASKLLLDIKAEILKLSGGIIATA